MPVRSLRSSVIKWPDSNRVRQALAEWALEIGRKHLEVLGIGYFGSYARGDWGVGSDIDLIVIVKESESPRERRAMRFDKENLPVPADLLVFTQEEWTGLSASGSEFAKMISREAVWLMKPVP